jgi:hypothetical protein
VISNARRSDGENPDIPRLFAVDVWTIHCSAWLGGSFYKVCTCLRILKRREFIIQYLLGDFESLFFYVANFLITGTDRYAITQPFKWTEIMACKISTPSSRKIHREQCWSLL